MPFWERSGKRTLGIFFQTLIRAGGERRARSFWRRRRGIKVHEGRLVNVDATIIAQQPKVYPHLAKMKANLAAALGIPARRVGIKATTNEGMGFVGREEGIAAMAVAAVDLPEV